MMRQPPAFDPAIYDVKANELTPQAMGYELHWVREGVPWSLQVHGLWKELCIQNRILDNLFILL